MRKLQIPIYQQFIQVNISYFTSNKRCVLVEHVIQYIAIGKILPLHVYYSTECHKKYKRLYRLSNNVTSLDETSSCDVCGTWYTCTHHPLQNFDVTIVQDAS